MRIKTYIRGLRCGPIRLAGESFVQENKDGTAVTERIFSPVSVFFISEGWKWAEHTLVASVIWKMFIKTFNSLKEFSISNRHEALNSNDCSWLLYKYLYSSRTNLFLYRYIGNSYTVIAVHFTADLVEHKLHVICIETIHQYIYFNLCPT